MFLLTVALLPGCATGRGLPPLWEVESGLPGDSTVRRAAFGLFEERVDADGTSRTILRPFGEARRTPDDHRALHVLPPLYERTSSPTSSGRTVLPLYFETRSGTDEQATAGTSDDDVWLFPFVAWGSEPGEGAYFLLLPVGGTLKGKLLADEITVRGFPLWIRTRDGDWRSTHLLWPLIAWGSSPTRSHFRVLPFWSQSDGERIHRRSLLWPFVHWSQERRGERRLDGWFVFPLVGHRAAADGSSWQWTFLFPFFQFARDEATGDEYDAVLWPFYRRSLRPGMSESTWWWPVWGETVEEQTRTTFWAWPLGWDQWETRGDQERRRRMLVPLWMKSESGPVGDAPTAEAFRSWPLVSWERDADGRESGRIPEIVPVFGWGPGERVYGDLLSLVRWDSDAEGRAAWDAPLGIVRYRKDAAGARRLTLLWWFDIPLGGGEPRGDGE